MTSTSLPAAGALLTIDLGALCDNWRLLRSRLASGECAAVVKADAYGLGAAPVAQALQRAGCRRFFVAHLSEAIALRAALDGTAEILVLHGLHPGAEADCVAHGLVPVLNSLGQIAAWQAAARQAGRTLPAALQVDTGMARLGLSGAEWARLEAEPERLQGIELRLVMSHLVIAEEQADPMNRHQRARFAALRARYPAVPASLANSSGIFLGPDFHFDLVRPGAALYGVAPVAGQPNPMRPVIRLQGQVLQVRSIDAGTPVGYAHSWVAPRPSRIATVAVGYADGYLRSLSNRGQAWLDGHPLPLVGKVSMDTVTLDVTGLAEDRIAEGSLVDLVDPLHGVDDLAARAGTIGYEVLTSLGHRYARSYLPDERPAAGQVD